MTGTYFNEIEPFAGRWLGALWPDAKVDGRSIADVGPEDVRGFRRAHFFAGIGGWEYALALAGWPDDEPVWTGSCPCQPFSSAGFRKGEKDSRHLWPEFRRIIALCRPATILGEQVASRLGREWLSGVRADLEALGYAVGCADLCAASQGAPHIRQRLFWVADGRGDGLERGESAAGTQASRGQRPAVDGASGGMEHAASGGRPVHGGSDREPKENTGATTSSRECRASVHGMELTSGNGRLEGRTEPVGRGTQSRCESGGLGDTGRQGSGWNSGAVLGAEGEGDRERSEPGRVADIALAPVATCWLGDTPGVGRPEHVGGPGPRDEPRSPRSLWLGEPSQFGSQDGGEREPAPSPARIADAWSRFDVLPCRDGKARRVESGTFPLAHGVPGRVGRLRGYGNAIVPQVAATFIRAFLECR